MGLGHSPRIVTDGLVLCLDAANKRSYGGSGTTWTDLEGQIMMALLLMDASNFDSANGGVLDLMELMIYACLDGTLLAPLFGYLVK